VLPIQLPRNHDLQQAYAVLLRKETPLDLARRTFRSTPTRSWPTGTLRPLPQGCLEDPAVCQRHPEPLRRHVLPRRRANAFPCRRYLGVLHPRHHDQHQRPRDRARGCRLLLVYKVPTLGQRLPGTVEGQFREATRSDALMFPLRRCMVATRTCVAGGRPVALPPRQSPRDPDAVDGDSTCRADMRTSSRTLSARRREMEREQGDRRRVQRNNAPSRVCGRSYVAEMSSPQAAPGGQSQRRALFIRHQSEVISAA